MRIKMLNPLVNGPGDEMTGIMWPWIIEHLLSPHVDLNLETYDLSLPNRDATKDAVTREFAQAILRHGVGVKCATITPNAERVKEYKLSSMWKSPNATIRGILDGVIIRTPILVPGISPRVPAWQKSKIVILRHGSGDIYGGQEIRVEGPGLAEIIFTPAGAGEPVRKQLREFTGAGVMLGMTNTDESIRNFARACLRYGHENGLPVWFAAKDTISQIYHARFRDIFAEEARVLGLSSGSYDFYLIDDAASRLLNPPQTGIALALMNFDGDVWSDLVAGGYGSLALMTSALYSPTGACEFEAAHGTVTAHYRKHQRGEETSTNSVASIFAWSGALRMRAQRDQTPHLAAFADRLEAAVVDTIAGGVMTGDLMKLSTVPERRQVSTRQFIEAVATKLKS